MDYNIIVTAYRGEARQLLNELKRFGKFTTTHFRDVLIGFVEDINQFIDSLLDEAPLSLARVMPLDEVIQFKEPDELLNQLKEIVIKHAKFRKKESFRVTVERRGWKGVINSGSWERVLGEIIFNKTGSSVNLEQPDNELVIEVMTNSCGIKLLSKEFKDKYYFVRSK